MNLDKDCVGNGNLKHADIHPYHRRITDGLWGWFLVDQKVYFFLAHFLPTWKTDQQQLSHLHVLAVQVYQK